MQERNRYGKGLFGRFIARLLKKSSDGLRNDPLGFLLGWPIIALAVSLHRIGLAGAGLPIRKDGAVVALDSLIHQLVDAALFEDGLLIVLLTEHMVELETLRLVVEADANFASFTIGKQHAVGIAVAPLGLQEGTDAHCNFNTRSHP